MSTPTPGYYPSQIALSTIEQRSQPEQQQRNREAIRLLMDWTNANEEDAAEQAATLTYLLEHLNEDHSNREIFSDETKQQLYQILNNDA